MTKADLKDAIEKAVKAERDRCIAIADSYRKPLLRAADLIAVKIRLGK